MQRTKHIDTEQIVMLVDGDDNFLGEYRDVTTCHTGKGLHHRAFIVFLSNSKGKVLLQKRKHIRWDKFWDISVTSHTLHLPDHDETYEEAAIRALKHEIGVNRIPLKRIGTFNYFAQRGTQCENEFVTIFQAKYEGEIIPNPQVVYECKWVPRAEFFSAVASHPEDYTPWAQHTALALQQKENK